MNPRTTVEMLRRRYQYVHLAVAVDVGHRDAHAIGRRGQVGQWGEVAGLHAVAAAEDADARGRRLALRRNNVGLAVAIEVAGRDEDAARERRIECEEAIDVGQVHAVADARRAGRRQGRVT